MSSLEQLYQQVILDHSRMRHGSGPVEGVQSSSHQVNPTCGDEVTLGVSLAEDGHIDHLVWDGDGCSISQASLSILSDLTEGKSATEISRLYQAMETMMHSRNQGVDDEVLDLLGDGAALEGTSQFANRVKCALLGWYALRDALAKLGTDIAGEGQ
ncbi:Fe-S cluster assembly sulfur transfer protein SufU [Schaalia sp. ZJ1691]|uniref:Fe-S cluster assembly sulfur transfer protein SufU n=1 Tax=Schaalia sp. ZJ1691 TaxID=2709404 RepID=UPI0013EB5EEB|nr:SUF system NifU family Fe-S cluster assembly protein [Schaalia sp. ZJ1691]